MTRCAWKLGGWVMGLALLLPAPVWAQSAPKTVTVVQPTGTNLHFVCDAGCGGSGGTSSSFGSAFPAAGTAIGFSDGTNMRQGRAYDLDSGAGTEYAQGVQLRGAASGGSVAIPGDATSGLLVNTELPAATGAPSGGAAPTAPAVWAYIACANEAGTAFNPCTAGDNTAHDAVDSGSPLKIGARATTSLSALTLVANADRTNLFAGIDGVLIIRPHANLEDRVSGSIDITDGASTAVVAAQGAGVRFCITNVLLTNTSATDVTVDLRDGAAGSVLPGLSKLTAPKTYGGSNIALPVPACTTANTALAADPSAAASTVTVNVLGFKTKL